MDPFLELTEKNHVLLQQMMEGLVRFDPEGKVIPCLAESC
jgi:ABC-type transport system substrate-binding protein